MSDQFDLVVIGSGPGGYVAAIRAAQLKLKVAIVERENLGGICLNWGCIPTKALLKSGEIYEELEDLAEYGLTAPKAAFDFDKIIDRSRKVAKQLSSGVAHLMKKNAIEVVWGTAAITRTGGNYGIRVSLNAGGERVLNCRSVIIATGARAKGVPAVGMVPDGERIWSYREALVAKSKPASLIVVGSGAIGIEFASFYRSLGSTVTVVEALDRILPQEDAEISAAAQKLFEKRGIAFKVPAKVTKVAREGSGAALEYESGGRRERLVADVALIAIGIEANVQGLGLEALGVEMSGGHIKTNAHGGTNVPGLYAIGDVAGPPWLAHKASHEGIHCVEKIAGQEAHAGAAIPGCTYSNPQVASVGLTEERARKQYKAIKVGRFPLRANGKALAAGHPDGFVKVIFDADTGQLLGAHMIGAEVTEMIQGYALAMNLEATEAELMAAVFPHPTISEAMHEAVLDAYGRVIHI